MDMSTVLMVSPMSCRSPKRSDGTGSGARRRFKGQHTTAGRQTDESERKLCVRLYFYERLFKYSYRDKC